MYDEELLEAELFEARCKRRQRRAMIAQDVAMVICGIGNILVLIGVLITR